MQSDSYLYVTILLVRVPSSVMEKWRSSGAPCLQIKYVNRDQKRKYVNHLKKTGETTFNFPSFVLWCTGTMVIWLLPVLAEVSQWTFSVCLTIYKIYYSCLFFSSPTCMERKQAIIIVGSAAQWAHNLLRLLNFPCL